MYWLSSYINKPNIELIGQLLQTFYIRQDKHINILLLHFGKLFTSLCEYLLRYQLSYVSQKAVTPIIIDSVTNRQTTTDNFPLGPLALKRNHIPIQKPRRCYPTISGRFSVRPLCPVGRPLTARWVSHEPVLRIYTVLSEFTLSVVVVSNHSRILSYTTTTTNPSSHGTSTISTTFCLFDWSIISLSRTSLYFTAGVKFRKTYKTSVNIL